MKLTGLKLTEPLQAPAASGLDAIAPLVRPVFVSDLHLSGRNKKTVLSFLWFLKTQARRFEELFLLGDIFEYWIGDDACSPAEFLARALRKYASLGKRIYMMQGNRDFLLGCDFARHCGAELIKVGMVVEAAGSRILLSHGDKWCTLDEEYQDFRRRMHDEAFQINALRMTVQERIDFAKKNGYDLVFLDTAGRLHIDEKLMDELKNIKAAVKPTEIILVVDAMTGQDAVTVAQTFDEALGIDGVLLSKMDGDARGGAALSVKAVTGKPIKFIGTGEKLGDIESFHPDRMASRILGMGDVLTLIEKAQQSFDQKQAAETAKKMMAGKLTLTDFYDQLQQMKNMGSMEDMLGMLPGVDAKALAGAKLDEKQMAHTEAIIQSMTPKERDNPSIINFSRKKRIAAGCGLTVEQVNKLLKQFDAMQKMTKQLTGLTRGKKKRRGFPGLGGLGGMKLPF